MIELPRVTLVAVEGVDANLALKALKISAKQIHFAKIKLLSPVKPTDDLNGIEWVQIAPMNYSEYNRFILFSLSDYIDTDFALTVQTDGFVLNADSWTPDFEQYDYIGAAWLPDRIMMSQWVTQEAKITVNNNVGNGGFSLRSKRLLNATKKAPFVCDGPEDAYICLNHYNYFIQQGIKFAPQEIAHIFSREQFNWLTNTFGFHGDKGLIYDYTV
jgi:hypothetical protein